MPEPAPEKQAKDGNDAAQKAQEEAYSPWEDLFTDAEVISVYTREQAIADGTLVDVTETAKEAGFSVPVALTAALWADIEVIPERYKGAEDVKGRLWDVLWMASLAARQSKGGGSQLLFPMILHTEETPGETEYRVKMHIGPGDNWEPVITLMLPDED